MIRNIFIFKVFPVVGHLWLTIAGFFFVYDDDFLDNFNRIIQIIWKLLLIHNIKGNLKHSCQFMLDNTSNTLQPCVTLGNLRKRLGKISGKKCGPPQV